MRCARAAAWVLGGVFSVGCGGLEAPGPASVAEGLALGCSIARGDEDCAAPGTSATQCRTREGAPRGVCVDDFVNPCASLGGEVQGCIFDQHCDGWALGWARCTDYGSLGPAGCGVCREQ